MRSTILLSALLLVGCSRDEDVVQEAADVPFLVQLPPGAPPLPVPAANPLTKASVELGKKLFFEKRLSDPSVVSCASCHFGNAFADTLAFSIGSNGTLGFRNAPTLSNVAYQDRLFMDGGVPDLEYQVLAPIHDALEMDHDINAVAVSLRDEEPYKSLSLLAYGRTLDAYVITRAIASYERTLVSGWSRFDRYMYSNDASALTAQELNGWNIFSSAATNCTACHTGFDLTDRDYHNVGLTTDHSADEGRARITLLSTDIGKFKTPTLRNIALTAPYMHDGSLATLEEVVDHFATGGLAQANLSPQIQPFTLTAQEKADLIAFLQALTDDRSFGPSAMSMKSNRFHIFLVLGSFALLASNCNPEEPEPPSSGGGGPTAYVLDIPSNLPPMVIPFDNPMTVEGVNLGRFLFYEERLSDDNSLSCAGCHAQSFGFTDNGLTFSEGINGIAGNRNAMALINLGWGGSFFWDGRSATLEEQILEPVINPIEMHEQWPDAMSKLNADAAYRDLFTAAFGVGSMDSVHAAKAIAQFLRTLISANSPYDKWKRGEGTIPLDAQLGYDLFRLEGGYPPFIPNGQGGADCFHCHTDAAGLFTDEQFHNNALDAVPPDPGVGGVTGDPFDIGKFKAPTLRNVAVTGPYMHDGRFNSLQQVIDHYNEGGNDSPTVDGFMKFVDPDETMELTPQKKAQVLAFLQQLTDTAFLTNPAFQDPGPP